MHGTSQATLLDRSTPSADGATIKVSYREPRPRHNLRQCLESAGYEVLDSPQGSAERESMSDRPAVAVVEHSLAGQRLDQIERRAILETLRACGGNKAKTARQLGVSEKTIYNKLKQYRINGKMNDEQLAARRQPAIASGRLLNANS